MELENQGGMGTELNHWEKRLLEVSADRRTERGCGTVCSPHPFFFFRFIVVPPGALKMQLYWNLVKYITSSPKLQVLKCPISREICLFTLLLSLRAWVQDRLITEKLHVSCLPFFEEVCLLSRGKGVFLWVSSTLPPSASYASSIRSFCLVMILTPSLFLCPGVSFCFAAPEPHLTKETHPSSYLRLILFMTLRYVLFWTEICFVVTVR